MHIKFNDKDIKKVKKSIFDISQFSGRDWKFKSINPNIVESCKELINYMNSNNNCIPFEYIELIQVIQFSVHNSTNFFTIQVEIKIDNLVNRFYDLYRNEKNGRYKPIDYINGDPIYMVDSLV